ncbi:hypothetical protein KM043_007008 [Ampulex compressa]|nr:hypothetical protein KM043_007008 [Ampulex compressa]
MELFAIVEYVVPEFDSINFAAQPVETPSRTRSPQECRMAFEAPARLCFRPAGRCACFSSKLACLAGELVCGTSQLRRATRRVRKRALVAQIPIYLGISKCSGANIAKDSFPREEGERIPSKELRNIVPSSRATDDWTGNIENSDSRGESKSMVDRDTMKSLVNGGSKVNFEMNLDKDNERSEEKLRSTSEGTAHDAEEMEQKYGKTRTDSRSSISESRSVNSDVNRLARDKINLNVRVNSRRNPIIRTSKEKSRVWNVISRPTIYSSSFSANWSTSASSNSNSRVNFSHNWNVMQSQEIIETSISGVKSSSFVSIPPKDCTKMAKAKITLYPKSARQNVDVETLDNGPNQNSDRQYLEYAQPSTVTSVAFPKAEQPAVYPRQQTDRALQTSFSVNQNVNANLNVNRNVNGDVDQSTNVDKLAGNISVVGQSLSRIAPVSKRLSTVKSKESLDVHQSAVQKVAIRIKQAWGILKEPVNQALEQNSLRRLSTE